MEKYKGAWKGEEANKIVDKKKLLFLLCLQGALISFNVASIAGVIPAMSRALGVPDFTMGNIIVAYMLPYGVAALLYGPLSRIVDTKKVTLCCLFLFSLSSFVSGIADSFYLLIFSRVVAGIAAAAIIPLSLVLIGRLVPYEKRGKAVGTFFSVNFSSSVTGVFLSGLVGWKWMFLVPALGGWVVIGLIFFLFPSIEREQRGFKADYFSVLFKDKRCALFAYIFLATFIYRGIYSWLGVFFVHKFELSQWWISLSLTGIGLGGVVGELVGGALSDKKGRIGTATCGVFLLSITTLGFVYTSSFLILGLLLLLHGLAWTINHSALTTILTDFPSHLRAEAISLNSSLRFVSGGIGTAVSGFWIARGFDTTFLVYAFSFLLLALMTRTMLGKSLPKKVVAGQNVFEEV
ncbi:MAG: MFS transporter [Thermodesulfobacteriota bacterium]